ncbi:MAG TPA: hypothetical protein DEO32_05120 [Ruminococcaceae bacterium]|nr:hypothetical protein [Oscillospiraceae bacterium]
MNTPSEDNSTGNIESQAENIRLEGERTPVKVDDTYNVESQAENIRFEGARTPVKVDETTINDDIDDYVFLKPRRKKRSSSSSHSGSTIHKVHKHKHKKMKTWKKVLIGTLSGLLAVLVAATCIAFCLVAIGQGELFSKDYNIMAPGGVDVRDDGQTVFYNGHEYKLNTDITSMLFMGIDKSKMEKYGITGTQGQADVIVMAAYDTGNKKITFINVPRDLMTDVPVYTATGVYASTERQQICLAYAYGDGKEKSCENVVTVVERLFYNIPIKTYLALDIKGVADLNDSIGGVDVVSPETIETFVKGQKYHLMGTQAERFVEARRHDNVQANHMRNERQKTYATSFMSDMFRATKKDKSVPVNVFNASAPYSVTNLTPTRVSYLAKEITLGGNPKTEIVSIDGELKLNGENAEFYLKEKEFYELFLKVFYERVS